MERGKPERSNRGRVRRLLGMVYNLTDDEIELLAYFSKLSERNKGRMIGHCLEYLSQQTIDEFKERPLISISTKKEDSRSTLTK